MRDFARLLLLAVVLPVLAIAALMLWQSRNAARAHYATQLGVAADMTARDVGTFLQQHRVALQLLAERSRDADGGDDAAWLRELERVHRVYPGFERLAVLDAQGRALATRPPATDTPFAADVAHARASGRVVLSNVHRGTPTFVTIAAPMSARGRFAGVVAGAIDTDTFPLYRGWSQARGFEVLLLDASGTVVRATKALPWRSGDALRDAPGGAGVLALRASRAGTEVGAIDGVFRAHDTAYAVKMPIESGWTLVVFVPEHAITGELRRNFLLVLGLLGLVLCGVLVIVWLQARRMGRSVRDLLGSIQQFTLEDPPTSAQSAAIPPELAPLAEAMHQFSIRCHDAYDKVNHGLQEQRRLREELERMARRLLNVQEDERRTLSRELHDDIGQAITAIKLGAMTLQEEDDADGNGAVRTREILAEIVATTDQTIAKLRNLSMLLRPPQLDTLGLETALRWQAETMFRTGNPQLTITMTPLPHRPSPEVELACFRIGQEAMTNILRHAEARRVRLSLAPEPGGDALRLEIEDDGRGFGPDAPPGLGMLTMRERAHHVGGELEMHAAPGQGVRICVVLPM